nr:DNA-3-methyladenine glycosylase [Membranihabitans marinus]
MISEDNSPNTEYLDFQSTDVVALAKSLLGYRLCTRIGGQLTSGVIVETEAYRAPEDKASHAYGNRRTARTEVIFKAGGTSYIYLCYGIHHLFNIVSGPPETAHAILVRALEPDAGLTEMRLRRGEKISDKQLTNGPGKLCQALGIDRTLNGLSVNKSSGNPLWVEPYVQVPTDEIIKSKRVGIDYAEEWKEKLWRFHIHGNPYVSVI